MIGNVQLNSRLVCLLMLNLVWLPIGYFDFFSLSSFENGLWWISAAYLYALSAYLGWQGILLTLPGMLIGMLLPFALEPIPLEIADAGSKHALLLSVLAMSLFAAFCYGLVASALRYLLGGEVEPFEGRHVFPITLSAFLAAALGGYSGSYVSQAWLGLDFANYGLTSTHVFLSDLLCITSMSGFFYLTMELAGVSARLRVKPLLKFPQFSEPESVRNYFLSIGAMLLTLYWLFSTQNLNTENALALSSILVLLFLMYVALHYSELQISFCVALFISVLSHSDNIYLRDEGFVLTQLMLVMIAVVGGLLRLLPHLRGEYARIWLDAVTDSLTKLYNRRQFDNQADLEIERAKRYQRDLSLLLLDIDYFKRVNDCHGHGVGDEVLQECAKRLQKGLRNEATLARVGGEEFAVLLPECDQNSALLIAERLRSAIAAKPFVTSAGFLDISASFGQASLEADEARNKLVQRADRMLYLAKQRGRNRVEHEPLALVVSN